MPQDRTYLISAAVAAASNHKLTLPPTFSRWGARLVKTLKDAEIYVKSSSPYTQYSVLIGGLIAARVLANIAKSGIFSPSSCSENGEAHVDTFRKKKKLVHLVATVVQGAMFLRCASSLCNRFEFSRLNLVLKILTIGKGLYDICTFKTRPPICGPSIITSPLTRTRLTSTSTTSATPNTSTTRAVSSNTSASTTGTIITNTSTSTTNTVAPSTGPGENSHEGTLDGSDASIPEINTTRRALENEVDKGAEEEKNDREVVEERDRNESEIPGSETSLNNSPDISFQEPNDRNTRKRKKRANRNKGGSAQSKGASGSNLVSPSSNSARSASPSSSRPGSLKSVTSKARPPTGGSRSEKSAFAGMSSEELRDLAIQVHGHRRRNVSTPQWSFTVLTDNLDSDSETQEVRAVQNALAQAVQNVNNGNNTPSGDNKVFMKAFSSGKLRVISRTKRRNGVRTEG